MQAGTIAMTGARPNEPDKDPRGKKGQPKGPRQMEDSEPWYRQFWPWFLIALPGSVVIAGFVTLYIANIYSDDLVVDNYYKDGLAINVELDKQRFASERGLSAALTIFEQRIQLRLQGEEYRQTLRLQLSHPLEADRDFTVKLTQVAPGLYDAELPNPVEPNWHWTLSSAADPELAAGALSTGDAGSSDWRLDGSLRIDNFINTEIQR